MLPESGRKVPKSSLHLSSQDLAERVGSALRTELGASRRATKTVMGWAGVSDKAARTWINGGGGLSGVHLLQLARQSDTVWMLIIEIAARQEAALGFDVHAVEVALVRALRSIELLKRHAVG